MEEIMLKKILKILHEHKATKYDYLGISNYFHRLYIDNTVKDTLLRYIDETQSVKAPDKLEFED